MVAQPSLSAAWVQPSAAPAQSLRVAPSAPPLKPAIDAISLRLAIDDGSLELVYQPEVEVRTGRIVAMEGLLRWRHEQLGIVQPHAFLPLAHRHGVMGSIDSWVLDAGAAQAAAWSRLPGPTRTLWLNVSIAQVADERFPSRVMRAINTHDLPPGALGLEISESSLIRLGDDIRSVLGRLRQFGVSLVADDVSSYYSGLGALATLPLDGVKLSHRFVRGVSTADHDNRARKVLGQAHEKGMHVVAEGVETIDEHARLFGLGCDRAHGFLYSSPLPGDQASWLLEQQLVWRAPEPAAVAGSG